MKAHPLARFIFNHIVLSLLFFHMFSAQVLAQFTDLNSPFKSPIKTITQDYQGFVWVASESSLAYFDGHQFRNIELKLKQSNHAIKITDMAFIADENLLIATQNHGLISHDLREPHATVRLVSVGDQTIYAIEASPEGHWIASQNGLYKLQGLNQVEFFPFPKSGLYINQIRYQQGQLLIASENQLLAFDTLKHNFQTVSYPQMDQTFYLWDIYFDTNQDLIISSNLGLYKRRDTGWLQLDLSDNKHVARTLSTQNGQIWAGTTTHGLIRPAEIPGRDIKQFALSNSDISSDAITTLFVDQDNNMWIGFFDGSISLISNNALAFGLNADVLNLTGCQEFTHEVTHFLEDQQFNLWITTSNDVIKLDKNNGTCKPLKLPDHLSIDQQAPIPRILFTDVKGQMWVNYYRLGLLKIDHSGTLDQDSLKPLYNPNKLFYQLVTQTDENTFVFATSRGLITYDLESLVSTTVPSDGGVFENSIVYGSHPWSESEFLLATSRGVAVFDGKSVKGNELIQNQLPSKKIQSVNVDSLNNIWIGTADAGLFKFNSNMTLVSDFEFLSSQGLNNITSIIEDDQQNLWVSAESSLLKVNLSTNETEIFNTSDGLQAKSFNIGSVYKASNGKLYFGGMSGFNAFFPQQVNTDGIPPPVMITQLSRFNKPIEPLLDYEGFKINQPINFTDQLTWSHKDYVMSLEFAALDYRAPEQNQYAYQLEGFDPGWNYVDANNRKAT